VAADTPAVTEPVVAPVRRPRRKLDREETQRSLIAAFDRVWSRDGIQGLGVNAVLKEAGLGKALLYRYFGDFVGLARAWAEGETFLPKPPALAGAVEPERRRPQVAVALAYARALRARPKTRELLIVELLRTSPVTDALDDMRARFGREMRGFVTAAGAPEGEDAFALSFFVTAAMTYLALRADAVPDYYGLKLDREADWERIEQMLERLTARVLGPATAGERRDAESGPAGAAATQARASDAQGGSGVPADRDVSASGPASPPRRRQP
jgi:AcrR family transcriptional regulator